MRMLNIWPWALLGSKLWVNVAISLVVKVTAKIDLSAFLQRLKGSSLELFIMEHCLAKKKLNNSIFFLKSVTYLFWWKRRYTRNFFVVSRRFQYWPVGFCTLSASLVFSKFARLLLLCKQSSITWSREMEKTDSGFIYLISSEKRSLL